MKKLYLFSGLGADYRAFQFLNFKNYEVKHIEWVRPDKNSTIEDYAETISKQITDKKPILIGVSFGGMIAAEVAKHIEVEKIIIISSIKSSSEIPWYYKLSGYTKLHRLMPSDQLKKSNKMVEWLFGTESESDKILLAEILWDTDPIFFKWALDKIIHWKNNALPPNIVHIHGTEDRILPYRFVKADFTILNGGHLMIVNRAKEISEIIQKILA